MGKKKIVFYNQIDYIFEAFCALCWLAEEKVGEYTLDELKKMLLEQYGADSEHTRNCLAFEENIWNRMTVCFADRMEQVKALFGKIEDRIIPVSLIECISGLMPEDFSLSEDTQKIRLKYDGLTREEKDDFFFARLTNNIEEDHLNEYISHTEGRVAGEPITDVERTCTIISYIQNMELKQESKLRVQDIYLKRDLYFEQATKLLEEMVQILKDYKEDMEKLARVWGDYWGKAVEEGSFLEKTKGALNIDDSMMEHGLCVMPCFIELASLWLHTGDHLLLEKENPLAVYRVGIVLTDKLTWNCTMKEEFRVDEIVPVCKLLGDKSKMDILLFIKDKPAYGSEIAKHFSLTTATVSHHMNKLLQLRLVQADLRDGKVYYQASKEMLQEFFEHAKQMFS